MLLVNEIAVSHPHPVGPGESTIGAAGHIRLKGGPAIVETAVCWNPPYCVVLTSRLPPTVVIGLYQVAAPSMMLAAFQNSYSGKRSLISVLVLIVGFS